MEICPVCREEFMPDDMEIVTDEYGDEILMCRLCVERRDAGYVTHRELSWWFVVYGVGTIIGKIIWALWLR